MQGKGKFFTVKTTVVKLPQFMKLGQKQAAAEHGITGGH
jgi:hypothetical protein